MGLPAWEVSGQALRLRPAAYRSLGTACVSQELKKKTLLPQGWILGILGRPRFQAVPGNCRLKAGLVANWSRYTAL